MPKILPVLAFLSAYLTFAPAQVVAGTLEHQGVMREYRLVGDPTLVGQRPLIVHLHGYRAPQVVAQSADLDVIAWHQLERLAMIERFVVAGPAALKGRWNMGIDLPDITLPDGQMVDDMGFVRKLVDRLVASGIADPHRIYLSGISDGGILAQRILCQSPHRFRAAASVIGSMIEDHAKNCRPSRIVPVFLLAGTDDQQLPYDGWEFPTGRELAVPDIAAFWGDHHRCINQVETLLPDVSKRDGSRVRQIDWTGCDRGHGVRLLRVEGGGHRVPTLRPKLVLRWAGDGQNRDIETAAKIWDFFEAIEAD